MKDFILTLVVVFILFRILGSFRSERIQREKKKEDDDHRGGIDKDGTRVEYIKRKPDDSEFTDYEIVDDGKDK